MFTFPNSGTNPCHLRDVCPNKMEFVLENFPICLVWNIYILVGTTTFIVTNFKMSLQLSLAIVCRLGEGPCQGFYIEHGAVWIFSFYHFYKY